MIYNSFKKRLLQGDINLDNGGDTIKAALCTSAYTPDQDAHEFFDDITDEVSSSGTNYSAGGNALGSKAVSQDNSGNAGVFDAADVVFANSTITARKVVLYKDTGNAATSPLIACFDFGSDKISADGDFTIQWDAAGILALG